LKIYRHKFHQYLNKLYVFLKKNDIKQFHNSIKQHQITNLNWKTNFIKCKNHSQAPVVGGGGGRGKSNGGLQGGRLWLEKYASYFAMRSSSFFFFFFAFILCLNTTSYNFLYNSTDGGTFLSVLPFKKSFMFFLYRWWLGKNF
jgi:hypothetical protein